ncbi:MAG: disulfide bond formation protein B [Sphingomonadaceae bacterium]
MTRFAWARLLALLLPIMLIAGAWGSQIFGGLFPCEMCHWQRWPHYAAILLALLAFLIPGPPAQRGFVLLAAIAIAVSGAIGVYHAGVEYGWWEGITQCSVISSGSGQDVLADIMASPLIRCDVAPWTLFGISLAGFNAIFSLGGAALIIWLWLKSR